MQNGRLASLLARKAQLDTQVQHESDHLKRTELKRQKLMLKEEIEKISA